MESESLENEIAEIEPGVQEWLSENLEKGTDKIRPVLRGWLSEKIGSSPGEEAVPSKKEQELALAAATKKLAAVMKRREEIEREMDRLRTLIEEGSAKERELALAAATEKLAAVMKRREEIEHEMDRLRTLIEEGEERIECIDQQLAGESCDSFLEKFSNAASKLSDKIWEVVGMAKDMVGEVIRLLVAIVIKNIVIPLVFLSIALKCSLPMIRYCLRLVPDMKQEVGRLRNLPERTDREA